MKAAKTRNCQQHTLSERHDVRKLKFTPFKKEDLATFKDADRKWQKTIFGKAIAALFLSRSCSGIILLAFVIVCSRFWIFMPSIVCNKLNALTFFPGYYWVLLQRLMNLPEYSNTRISWKIVETQTKKYICSFEYLIVLAWYFFYLRASL